MTFWIEPGWLGIINSSTNRLIGSVLYFRTIIFLIAFAIVQKIFTAGCNNAKFNYANGNKENERFESSNSSSRAKNAKKPDEKRKIRVLLFSIRHIQHKTIIRTLNTPDYSCLCAVYVCQLFKRSSFATLGYCIYLSILLSVSHLLFCAFSRTEHINVAKSNLRAKANSNPLVFFCLMRLTVLANKGKDERKVFK